MPPYHVLPIPVAIRALAYDTVSSCVRRLPFEREGVAVTCDLIAAGMEALNAQATRTLCLKQETGPEGRVQADGLDKLLLERGFVHPDAARVLSTVLERAGISVPAAVPDRKSRRIIRGTRLDPAWAWDILSIHRKPFVVQGTAPSAREKSASWQQLCPVCTHGTLNAVAGQKLFGIPPTGFLLCTSCGAKFVPDDTHYRLVSIAIKKDPLWGRYLNRSMSPDAWETIARESRHRRTPPCTRKKDENKSGISSCTSEKTDKNNSRRLAVPVGTGTLFFTMIPLQYRQGHIHDLFSKNKIPVSAIIRLPAYRHLRRIVEEDYANYLDVPVGFFLSELKGRKDGLYREFLHRYGDETFGIFRTGVRGIAAKTGVFAVAVKGQIRAAGSCRFAFSDMINDELGSLSPATCYRDGDPGRCRINALLCSHRKDGGMYVHPVEDNDEIARIVGDLDVQVSAGNALAGQ